MQGKHSMEWELNQSENRKYGKGSEYSLENTKADEGIAGSSENMVAGAIGGSCRYLETKKK